MRILVSGGSGMVGSAVKEVFKNQVVLPKKYELNVGNLNQVMRWKDITHIIHLAAETDHEFCELNASQAYFINTIGTANMTMLAKKLDIPIMYLAAGSIFDGKKKMPYTVKDKPNPLNHYNISKYYGEFVVKQHSKHWIVRAGWMFGGGSEIDKKFVNKIIKKIRNGDREIKVCDDCIGSPIYTKDLSECMKQIIELKHGYGTYHIVNDGSASRYEFALYIKKYLKSSVKIIPCKINDLKEEFPCKRTNYEVLESSLTLRHWKKALEEYINAYYRY